MSDKIDQVLFQSLPINKLDKRARERGMDRIGETRP